MEHAKNIESEAVSRPQSDPAAPFDRAQAIRRSLRCFVFGLIGAIPFLGLSMSWLAFRIGREISAATGERVRFSLLNGAWLCGLALIDVYAFAVSIAAAVAVGLLFLALQIFLLRREYKNNSPRKWNPARHFFYWGIGLAYTGRIGSVFIFVFFFCQWLEEF